MATDGHTPTNGYVRLTTLVMVAVPVLSVFAAAVSLFVSMSISPVQKQLDQQADAIAGMRADLVPRKEHDRDWASQDQRFGDLQRQINSLRDDLDKIYTPGDALKRLQERIDQLDAEVHQQRSASH